MIFLRVTMIKKHICTKYTRVRTGDVHHEIFKIINDASYFVQQLPPEEI